MAGRTTIEWTEVTWNPVAGCTPVSPGCHHCYAARMALRLAGMSGSVGSKYRGTARNTASGRAVFTGRVNLDPDSLEKPIRWRAPRVVFVNSMSDLFHEDIPLHYIQSVFQVMATVPRHQFQVLTKRPDRARELAGELPWPENVWMGTSVESPEYYERVRSLRELPASIRFLSCEPLLARLPRLPLEGINWVIVGGESGPRARPMDEDWVVEIRDRCAARGVPFFFKQWGGVRKKATGRVLRGRTWSEMPRRYVRRARPVAT
jgi:protein gp37